MMFIFLTLFLSTSASAFDRLHRFQRGDQGPDDEIFVRRSSPHIRGPNVCSSSSSSEIQCCPGWTQSGGVLCLVPICSGCGSKGRCIKPETCICGSGIVSSHCQDENHEDTCSITCLNGGVCQDGACVCRTGYAGDYCQEPVCEKPCENGGRCIGPERCACVYGYTGRRCEIDFRTGLCYRSSGGNSCSRRLHGMVCTKQLCCATVGKAWGHPCEKCELTHCQMGFLQNVHTGKCMDIDECEAIHGLCSGGECVNTVGSFKCICPPGMMADDNNECHDYDECSSSDAICPNGICVNKDPGYYCICNPGFIPTQDRKGCLDARQGRCFSSWENGRCESPMTFTISKLDCCCDSSLGGQAWGQDNFLCEKCPSQSSPKYKELCPEAFNVIRRPIDTCALRPNLCRDGGECINIESGYKCRCFDGYQLDSSGTRCVDIDECNLGYCSGSNSLRCINIPGSVECHCRRGFHYNPKDGTCSDLDECTETGSCLNGRCSNMDGSFECICDDGYERDPSGHFCYDIDECLENSLICLHGQCINTPGEYRCQCQDGFIPSDDGSFCLDRNECSDPRLCREGTCINNEGGYTCLCNPGFQLDNNRCIDIDECLSNPCGSAGKCINTNGGFHCECLRGFAIGPDGRTCSDSIQGLCYSSVRNDQCSDPSIKPVSKSICCCSGSAGWGFPCEACPTLGSKEFRDLCPYGSGLSHTGNDINECALDPDLCGEFGACDNLIGTYRCQCLAGYEPDITGKFCRDMNECERLNPCQDGSTCKNTPGNYTCLCPLGTVSHGHNNCLDIDECAEHICSKGECINTIGSFECRCPNGYQLDVTGKECVDFRRGSCWMNIRDDRCENDLKSVTTRSECCCSALRGVAWGSPCEYCDPLTECSECPVGMIKPPGSGNRCMDIDECLLDPGLCKGGTCINLEGGFLCRCPPGMSLDYGGTSCIDERMEPCYLNYQTGICSDELSGFYKRNKCCCTLGEGWGFGCSQCPRPGTQDFDYLCPRGYGYVDKVEVNECLAFPGMCENGRCRNSVGSFTCRCNQGYTLDEHGVKCVNIDECQIITGVCGNGTCIDIPGSFMCDCDPGFEITPLMQVIFISGMMSIIYAAGCICGTCAPLT